MPYRVGQSTGHLLGLVSFLLPATLLALERRRLVLAARVPRRASALGPAPPRARRDPARARLRVGAASARGVVEGGRRGGARRSSRAWSSSAGRSRARSGSGRSFAQVERYSAELSDFVRRVGRGGRRGARLPRLADAARRARRARRDPQARGLARAARARRARAVPPRARGEPSAVTRRSGASYRASRRRASRSALCRSRASRSPRSSRSRVERGAGACDRQAQAGSRRSRSLALVCSFWRSTSACRCSARSPPTRRAPPTPRCAGRGGCSSCRCSAPTSTSGARTSATRGRARASGRRATRRSRPGRRAGSRASCAGCRADAGESRRASASGTSPCTGASTRRAASSTPPARGRAEAALRRTGWRGSSRATARSPAYARAAQSPGRALAASDDPRRGRRADDEAEVVRRSSRVDAAPSCRSDMDRQRRRRLTALADGPSRRSTCTIRRPTVAAAQRCATRDLDTKGALHAPFHLVT